jgi:putative DNA primase/helicase
VLDTVIRLKRPGDYRQEEGARFEVHYEKHRGFYGDDAKPFEARLIQDANGKHIWTMKDMEDSLGERVMNLINEGLDQKDIAVELGISPGYVSKLKKKAQE